MATTCFFCLSAPREPVNLCATTPHEECCTDCWRQYATSVVESGFLGMCPRMLCPSAAHVRGAPPHPAAKAVGNAPPHTTSAGGVRGMPPTIPFSAWAPLVSAKTREHFQTLALSLLSLRCAVCDRTQSLDVMGTDPLTTPPTFTAQEDVSSFLNGALSTDALFERVMRDITRGGGDGGDDARWLAFSCVLRLIPDPERRVSLHLRYVRDFPLVRSLCCAYPHCFRCKTKAHDGQTCDAMLAMLDPNIARCAACNVAVVRGDGCDSITCVCGHRFSWSERLKSMQALDAFRTQFPTNPHEACARILCTATTPPSARFVLACAWHEHARAAVDAEIVLWFRRTYPEHTMQCAVVITRVGSSKHPPGVRNAARVWLERAARPLDVTRCRQQDDIALASLFLTMVPSTAGARAFFATKLTTHPLYHALPGMHESAMRWIQANRPEYKQEETRMYRREAEAFLRLFGAYKVGAVAAAARRVLPHVRQWNRALAHPDLVFADDACSVICPSAVVTPPRIAYVPLDAGDVQMVRMRIATTTNDALQLHVGMFDTSRFGESQFAATHTNSLCSLCVSTQGGTCTISSSTGIRRVSLPRPLRADDVLAVLVNLPQAQICVVLNDCEWSTYLVSLHPIVVPLCFAAIVPSGHRVTLCAPSSPLPRNLGMNFSHRHLYDRLRLFVHALLFPTVYSALCREALNNDADALFSLSRACAWISRHDGWMCVADAQFHALRPTIEALLFGKEEEEEDATATWNEIVEAVAWFRVHKSRFDNEASEKTARAFRAEHGVDAAFIAAMTVHGSREEDEKKTAALAFMRFFPREMQAWYDQDQATGPHNALVSGVAAHCRCLPRHVHIRKCPNASSLLGPRGECGCAGTPSGSSNPALSGPQGQHGVSDAAPPPTTRTRQEVDNDINAIRAEELFVLMHSMDDTPTTTRPELRAMARDIVRDQDVNPPEERQPVGRLDARRMIGAFNGLSFAR